jgi:catechol 2,3-dioxygenase
MTSPDTQTTAPVLPATLRMGPVELTVTDLDRSVDFYETSIGQRVHGREGNRAALGAGGEDLLVLTEEPGALPADGYCGLFHFALLVPDRADLARWLAHAARERVPLAGLSDHDVSEAIYLRDPDFHGIEIYRDRPREEWPRDNGGYRMASDPLDLSDLLAAGGAAEPFAGVPGGTRMGHVHLHVADIPETERFYRDVLGFDVVAHLGDQATFMSAGGYHHHVGANVWAGRGATPPPPGSAALRHATILVPDAAERDRVADRVSDAGGDAEPRDAGVLVRDPAGNGLLVAVG